MPSTSKAQQHLMSAAEHGAQFPMARQVRESMSMSQLHDFAATKTKRLPEHVAHHIRKVHEHVKAAHQGSTHTPTREHLAAALSHLSALAPEGE